MAGKGERKMNFANNLRMLSETFERQRELIEMGYLNEVCRAFTEVQLLFPSEKFLKMGNIAKYPGMEFTRRDMVTMCFFSVKAEYKKIKEIYETLLTK